MTARVPLIACVAVLAFFAGITAVRLAYALAYALILVLIVAFIWSRSVARRIRVTRDSPKGQYMIGEPFEETFTAHNTSGLRLPYCEVYDMTELAGYTPGRAFSLPAGGKVTWRARGVFTKRGRHRFGPLEARLGDPFGLFPRRVRVASYSEVIVYPAIHPLDEVTPLWSGSGGADIRKGRPVDVAPDVSSIREYDPHDGLSRIHWPTTARVGKLMSRLYDTRQSADILVVLDLQRGVHVGRGPDSTLEYAVSLAASVCHAAIRRGQAVGLITNNHEVTGFGAGRGEVQRMRILDFLALAEDDGGVPLAETIRRHGAGWRGRGGLVVITSNREQDWVEALVDTVSRGQRHLCIFVEPASFGARGPALRVPAAWRLVIDWWIVRRGDVISVADRVRAVGS